MRAGKHLKLTKKLMLGIGIILFITFTAISVFFYYYVKHLYLKETYRQTELLFSYINPTVGCGWLTSSVAKHTVELLNANAEGNFKDIHKLSKEVQSCMSCHEKGGTLENTRGMMDCGGCHFRGPSQHPKT
jgi:hypothetical protein